MRLQRAWRLALCMALFLPWIPNQVEPRGMDGSLYECGTSAFEHSVMDLLRTHPDQARPRLVCDPLLVQVARERAVDMSVRTYISHVDPDGHGAVYYLRRLGYPLPAAWDDTANPIESIAAGYSTPQSVLEHLTASAPHAAHMLGLDPFFAAQTCVGVGYYEERPRSGIGMAGYFYRWYVVILTAPPGPGGQCAGK